MGIRKYDIKERAFDPTQADRYELSILLGVGSFTYVVREARSRSILVYRSLTWPDLALADWTPNLLRTVQEDEVLRPGLIRKVYVGWITERVTLVPSRLFQAGREADFLAKLTTIGLEDRCRSEALPDLGAQLLYAIGADRVDGAERRLSPLRQRHYATGLLNGWCAQSRAVGNRAVFASLRDGQLFLAALDAGKLRFFNSFTYQTAQDALYYTVLCFEQSGWGTNRVPLYLCGEILRESDVYKQFFRFIEDIRFVPHTDERGKPGQQLSDYPTYLYFDILSNFP